MKNIVLKALCMGLLLSPHVAGQTVVDVKVDASAEKIAVSPYIFGKNGCISDGANPSYLPPKDQKEIKLMKEAGLRFTRQSGGNNSTKYNWRACLSSHPDWYNNVYAHDWNASVVRLQSNVPDVQAMFSFQLTGYAASTNEYNFDDYSYNNSQWWSGTVQNLAGGGELGSSTKAEKDGDYSLYLKEWPADSTTAILNYWMNERKFDMSKLIYWSMDNEPEIWCSTHDDLPLKFTADELVEKYIDVAKKARALYPDIKLCGPVTANEWQWFKFREENLKIDGRYYCWLEYFIKRIADEQKASGVRLLDVFDLHWYPSANTFSNLTNLYRVFYDENYSFPEANGLHTLEGGWDNNYKEFIFGRVNEWLDEHFGENHGIKLALTETAFKTSDPNVVALTYGSFLGTFMENGVELFSPWEWQVGMWETMHLFSRYSKNICVSSSSSDENVSAFSTVNDANDSLTVILLNRSEKESLTVNVNVDNINVGDGVYKKYQLYDLPNTETFVSHEENALKVGYVKAENNKLSVTLPAKSITAVVLSNEATGIKNVRCLASERSYFDPTDGCFHLSNEEGHISSVDVYDVMGRKLISSDGVEATDDFRVDFSELPCGVYMVGLNMESGAVTKKVMVRK